MNQSIGIVVPLFDGGETFKECLHGLRDYKDCLTVLDSGSNDGSLEVAKNFGIAVQEIDRADFNHGSSREKVRNSLACSIIVFLSQDVIIRSADSIKKLVQPLINGEAEVSYGRQIPKEGSYYFERFPREFNYPGASQIRDLNDVDEYGAFTFFCSNAFAAYSQRALDEVGGFDPTLSHEDYFTVAKILKRGGRIAYVAEAEVVHSHNYSLWQEFQRYFDAGYVRAVNPWVTKLVGQAENHGSRFFKFMIRRLAKENPKLIPYAFIQTFCKWLGYRLGYVCFRGPTWLKKLLSGQSYYFDSKYYQPGKN